MSEPKNKIVRVIPKKIKSESVKIFNKKKSAKNNILRTNKYLIADIAFPTKNEIIKIIKYCIKDKSPESYTLLLSLLTGRKLSKLKLIQIESKLSNYHKYSYGYDLKKKKPPPEYFLKNLHVPENTVELPLPKELIDKNILNMTKLLEMDEYEKYIRKANKKLKINLSTNRISNYDLYPKKRTQFY